MSTTAPAPTKNERLLAWVEEVAALTEPDEIHWCDGSAEEYDRLVSAADTRRAFHADDAPEEVAAMMLAALEDNDG